jgi:hypothetical protein
LIYQEHMYMSNQFSNQVERCWFMYRAHYQNEL